MTEEETMDAGALPLTTDELAELERLARAATPGPWTRDYGGQNWWIASCGMGEEDMTVWCPTPPTPDHGGEREDDGGEADRRNAAYIAAVSPDVVLRLLAAAREPVAPAEAAGARDTVFAGPHNGCTYERPHVHPSDSPEEAMYLREGEGPREFRYGELGSSTAVTEAAERVMQWADHHEPWNPTGDFKALRLALDAFEAARWPDAAEELARLAALAQPPAPVSAERAWGALRERINEIAEWYGTAKGQRAAREAIDQHRPAIEAAIRGAEAGPKALLDQAARWLRYLDDPSLDDITRWLAQYDALAEEAKP